MDKQVYHTPRVEDYGTVADLTQTGQSQPGTDGKGGSSPSTGG